MASGICRQLHDLWLSWFLPYALGTTWVINLTLSLTLTSFVKNFWWLHRPDRLLLPAPRVRNLQLTKTKPPQQAVSFSLSVTAPLELWKDIFLSTSPVSVFILAKVVIARTRAPHGVIWGMATIDVIVGMGQDCIFIVVLCWDHHSHSLLYVTHILTGLKINQPISN